MEMLKPLLCKIRNCTKIYLLQATRVTYFFSNVATVISRMNPQRKHFIVKITRLWGTLYLRNSVCDLKLFVFLTIRIYTLYLMVHYQVEGTSLCFYYEKKIYNFRCLCCCYVVYCSACFGTCPPPQRMANYCSRCVKSDLGCHK